MSNEPNSVPVIDVTWPKPIEPPAAVKEIAAAIPGAKIDECAALPDGSGFATMSFPLPEDHWIYGKDDKIHPVHGFRLNPPPMVFRMGENDHAVVARFPNDGFPPRHDRLTRNEFAEKIRACGKYAVRSATMDGKEDDFDPDALLQNLVVAFLGYWTENGLSEVDWANPPKCDGNHGGPRCADPECWARPGPRASGDLASGAGPA